MQLYGCIGAEQLRRFGLSHAVLRVDIDLDPKASS